MEEKYGYLHFSVTADTIFSFDGQEFYFDPQDPERQINAIATLIQQNGITHVICNKIGFGLCGSISQHLKTKYNNYNCQFALNEGE